MNLFTLFWSITTLSVLILGLITIYLNQYLPELVSNLIKFGKLLKPKQNDSNTKSKLNQLIALIQVPKSYFIHFYIFAVIYHLIILLLLFTNCFSVHSDRHELIDKLMTLIIGRNIYIEAENALKSRTSLILMTSLLIQYIRRLYENKFINIFSNSKINLIHYLAGFMFYISCGLALMDSLYINQINYSNVNHLWSYIAFLILILMSGLQFKTHLSLSKLRRGVDGQIKSYSHFIPTGGLFDYISCPHYLCEIIIYLCIYIISRFNNLWAVLLFWVVVNQTIAALLTHNWYRSSFGEKYPKWRKAVIPFIL